jgi:hypothetical protein
VQPPRIEEISNFRLRRHHLLDESPPDLVSICRDLCGVQAQVMPAAYLQLWARNHALRRAEIEDALWKSRWLVRTSLMRQTLHLIPTDEFPLYISALRSCRVADALRVMARFGITREEAEALTPVILDALADGPRGRAEIAAALRPKASRRVQAWMERCWSHVRLAVAEGLICYGSGENKKVKFIRVDHWLPKLKMELMPAVEAQSALLRKYLRAYGPATLRDFSHWSGIQMREVKLLGPAVDGKLIEIAGDGKRCLMLRADADLITGSSVRRKSKRTIRLLPNFDVYLLAHHEKDHLLAPEHYKRVYHNQWWISPVVLSGGVVAGVWSYKVRKQKLEVSVEAFGKFSKGERDAIEREAQNLGSYFDCEAATVIS